MKKRKQFAFNKLFNFCMVSGALLTWVSIAFFRDNDSELGLIFGIIALPVLLLPAIFTPYCYAFDSEGISLRYIFLPVERYLWKDIRAIEVQDIGGTKRFFPIDFFYAFVFCIEGENVGESRFYMTGHIRKSFHTKRLLEKYWDGTITGYLFENIKNRINKRRAKKQVQVRAHLTDEVVPMERDVRAEVREWLNPLIAQAKQYDLDIKTSFIYITKDNEEWFSRPKEGYTYTLAAKIAHFNEADKNRAVTVKVDLLYVRLGKTAYRGVKNKHIGEALKYSLSDMLIEIGEKGIDVFLEES